MSISSLDSNYLKAVEDLEAELLKIGLPKKYAAIVAAATKQPASPEFVKPARVRFPGDTDVVEQFAIQGLWQTVQQAMASDNVVLTTGQSAAIQLQLSALLEFRRHYGRKKLPRMQQIVRASHRRAIVTGSEGSVRHDLVRRITRTLLAS